MKVLFLAYPSENYTITNDLISYLFSKLKNPSISRIINFIDFDRAGRKSAYTAKRDYDIDYVFLTNGELGLPNNNAKDITDYVEKHSIEEAVNLINFYIKYYIIDGNSEDGEADYF
jgi:hypothetical protein